MRILTTILFFCIYDSNAAANYYVASSGSNLNAGTSTGSPFLTIAKATQVYSSGDTINLNSGDSWQEKVTIPASVYVRAYGSGSKPLITAFASASMTNAGSNIWFATISTPVVNLNVVSINGTVRQKARFPNAGYLTVTTFLSTTQLKIAHDATSRTGRQIVVRDANWSIDTSRVSQHLTGGSFDTLVLSPAITYGTGALGGNGYFFQNDSTYLDSLNEWSFNPVTNRLSVYATSLPVVQYSTVDTLVNIHQKNSVVFDGVQFTGANMMAISADSLRYDTIKNCSFNNNNTSIYLLCTKGFAIINDSLQNNLNIGYHSDPDTSLYVYGNYIKNTGLIAGMGGNGYSTYTGGYNNGKYAMIKNNIFKNSGYHGVRFQQQFDTLYHNYVDSFALIKGDGAGIYTFVGTAPLNIDSGCLVRGNIITNGFGAPVGSTGVIVIGLYLDVGSYYVTADSNLITGIRTNAGNSWCIGFHGIGNVFKDNLLVDSISPCMANVVSGSQNNGVVIKRNIFFNNNASSYLLQFQGVKDSTETIDSNYYLMPVAPQVALNANGTSQRLSTWQAYYPTYDVHSTDQLPTYYATVTPTLYYNPTLSDSTISFALTKVDAKNNYYNSVTLKPFTSVLLFPSTRQIIGNLSKFRYKTVIQL